jgi:molybdopterin synthase sulfur carrier subunit
MTNNLDTVQAEGSTIIEVIDNLNAQFPGIKERLADDQGNLRRFVNIYINGEDVRFLEDKSTAVKDGDEISIVPAIAGG